MDPRISRPVFAAWGRIPRAMVAVLFGCGILAGVLLLQMLRGSSGHTGGAAARDAVHRVLCAGDSLTYGVGVDPARNYPARLRETLAMEPSGVFEVRNAGIPGLNTAQIRHRIPDWIARYSPQTIVLWAGVNNAWNRAERDQRPASLLEFFDRHALRSRAYRRLRTRWYDFGLEPDRSAAPATQDWALAADSDWKLGSRKAQIWTLRRDGRIERIRSEPGGTELEIVASAEADLQSISDYARANGIELVFVAYPVNMADWRAANSAMWRVAERGGHPLVRSWKSVDRLPTDRRDWLWGFHPGENLYREIAHDVARVIVDPSDRRLPCSAEEFEAGFRELDGILLGLAMGLSRATPPVTAKERRWMRELFGRPLMLRTQPLSPDEFDAWIQAQGSRPFFREFFADIGAESAEALRVLAGSDGQISPPEEAFVARVAAVLRQRADTLRTIR